MAWTRRVAAAAGVAAGALSVASLGATAVSAQATALPDNVPQTPPPPPPGVDAALDSARAVKGQSLQVSVYTYGPGDAVFERFGHIALALSDAQTGEDIAFNWGMFDFDQPNFLGRFLTGDTRYWMAGYRTLEFNAAYQAQNRTIRRQLLQLTPVQRGALADFLAWNAREENRYYRYDYYNDNCSTRVRDALDWVLGGALAPALDRVDGHHTWRDETARITADNLPVYVGIQVALGRNADRHLTRWQLGFLPEYLADDLAATALGGVKLVARDTVLFTARRDPMPVGAPYRIVPAIVAGVVLVALVVGLARVAPAAPAALGVFGVLWYGVGGVLGTALLLAGTVTKHVPYMGANLNLTILSPLLLAAAAVWWMRGRAGRAGRAARGLSAIVALIALAGLVIMHVPGLTQGSMLLFMTCVPVHLALAIVARRGHPAGA